MRTEARKSSASALPSGRRRCRGLVAALAIAATALTGAVTAAPADAAGPEYPRVVPVAASASYLVYRQQTTNAYGLFFPKGVLRFVGRTGGRHLLKGFDLQHRVTLQGTTVVQSQAADAVDEPASDASDAAAPQHVRWRDLRTGAGGTVQMPAGDDLMGAAPGGWIAIRSSGAADRLIRYSTDGSSTDLGAAQTADGARVTYALGPKGVLVSSDADRSGVDVDGTGLIRYLPYGTPGRWRTVYAAGAGVDTVCTKPSATHVVCEVDRPGAKHSGQVLLALDGSTRAWLSDHRRSCQVVSLVAVGRGAVGKAGDTFGSCVEGRLTRLGADGRLTVSKRLWGPHAGYITAGLGGILLDSADQRRIIALTGVRAKPRTVVAAG